MNKLLLRTLDENAGARGVISVARQRISNAVSRAFPLYTLLQPTGADTINALPSKQDDVTCRSIFTQCSKEVSYIHQPQV